MKVVSGARVVGRAERRESRWGGRRGVRVGGEDRKLNVGREDGECGRELVGRTREGCESGRNDGECGRASVKRTENE
jgi:hypothetical protein